MTQPQVFVLNDSDICFDFVDTVADVARSVTLWRVRVSVDRTLLKGPRLTIHVSGESYGVRLMAVRLRPWIRGSSFANIEIGGEHETSIERISK
jgi:hypothetical protein